MATNILVLNKSWLVTGEGDPEGHQDAPIGSIFLREDGGAGAAFYVKEAGTGNTGWRCFGKSIPAHHASHEPGGLDAIQKLSATILTSGILPDERLSDNVPRLADSNVFSGPIQEMGIALRTRNPTPPADQRLWQLYSANNGYFNLSALTDVAGGEVVACALSRTGNLILAADLYEKSRPTPMGHWVDVPFNPANFSSGAGGTWTVGAAAIINNRYAIIGKTLHWEIYISWFSGGNSFTGAAASVYITVPGGYQPHGPTAYPVAALIDGGVFAPGYAGPSGNALSLTKMSQANFTPGAIGITAAFAFEVF